MEWAVAALIFFSIFVWMGVSGLRKKRREEEAHLQSLQHSTEKYRTLLVRGDMPNLEPAVTNYRPVANEQIYALIYDGTDNRSGIVGRSVVTNKAVVFESPTRSDRFPLTSLSALDIAADGFTARRRSGPVRAFRTGENADLLGLIQVASWGLN